MPSLQNSLQTVMKSKNGNRRCMFPPAAASFFFVFLLLAATDAQLMHVHNDLKRNRNAKKKPSCEDQQDKQRTEIPPTSPRALTSTFVKCGFSSRENFKTWYGELFTNSPVLFPTDDSSLRYILQKAKANGCRVRVRGAGHTEDGFVMQKLDETDNNGDVIIVNLKDYIPDDAAWNGVLHRSSDSPSIRISAGASLLKMMSIIRPQGYLPTTSFPSPPFSVGGPYLNPSCHGATYGESRLAAQVIGMRVMTADGEIKELSSSSQELKDFRGSMGLLGIATALEIRIRQDTGLEMKRDSFRTSNFNKAALREFLDDKLTNNNGTEFFYYIHEDVLITYEFHFSGDPSFNPLQTTSYYDEKLSRFPDLAYTGGEQALPAKITETAAGVTTSTQSFAKLVALLTRQLADEQFYTNAAIVRDGFFVSPDNIPRFEAIEYLVKCSSSTRPYCIDEIIDLLEATRSFLMGIKNDKSSDWFPTLPVEWRLFSVEENEMTLEHLSPGTYVAFEHVALQVDDDTVYSKYHKQLEDIWRNLFPGGGIHHGKAYAYGPVSGMGDNEGLEFPFQDEAIIDSVYDEDVRSSFATKMELHDPTGTFAAGSMLRLLGLTKPEKKYTPKQYNGGSCTKYGDGECISSCCYDRFLNLFTDDTCIPGDKRPGESCVFDCECEIDKSGNPCRWSWRGKKCHDR